jgi:hypothetical protein
MGRIMAVLRKRLEKRLSIVEIKYEGGMRKIEGTRAEEWNGRGSLVVYDGDSVVARSSENVESWSAERQ